MVKKIKETRFISGKSIQHMQGNDTWITCITDKGEKFSISFTLLFKLFNSYEFLSVKHGERFRAKEFFSVEELNYSGN